ncbi:hypothetical protein HAINFHK1212_0167 [Haemophilus influenzae HK1212]|uniref:Uncharacterized protein n=1 Tax=Haemophilus influenzae HK1212 TaxID=456482 RepID=A0A7G2K0D9_HAEIF|nr:hypothetical protein HAINFHK1212_0167 [Haemophilus influenzae HK1212]
MKIIKEKLLNDTCNDYFAKPSDIWRYLIWCKTSIF